MTFLWAGAFTLLIVIVLTREHQDRKKPVLVGELVQGDKFAPPIKKTLVKSWWDRIWEFIKSVLVGGVLIGGGWVLHDLLRLAY